jgi:hypothetical protein
MQLPLLALIVVLTYGTTQAQVPFRELPIEKPKERTKNDPVPVKTRVNQAPSTSRLYVLLNPIIQGQVTIRDTAGRVIKQEEANPDGQVEFILPRGQSYQIEASYPGYNSKQIKTELKRDQKTERVNLTASSRSIRLLNLPPDAKVLIDDTQVEVKQVAGVATVADLPAGIHKLTIRHPEYSDYVQRFDFNQLNIGEFSSHYVNLEKVARVTVQSSPGASVMIDGRYQGQVPPSGKLSFDIPINDASEHTITLEMTGYQSRTERRLLKPGEVSLEIKLEPVITDAGTSDGFDDLIQWNAPRNWKLEAAGATVTNRQLHIVGQELGLIRDKVFKDFEGIFTVWMPDGKGASWAMRADQTGKNYLLFHLAGPQSPLSAPKRFYTFHIRDGTIEQVDVPTPLAFTFDPKASYTIEITARGSIIEHWITSNETGERVTLGSYTMSAAIRNDLLYGTFGFRALKDETFIVDDLSIKSIKESASARP